MGIDLSGNIYIADANNQVIRKVDTSGNISTIAGNQSYSSGGDDGPATSAGLSSPTGVTVDNSGNLYIADTNNGAIRKVNTSGIITTFASGFNTPNDVAVDISGNVYVADTGNNKVFKIDTSLNQTLLTDNLSSPQGITVDISGNVYIADTYNSVIRKVTATGTVSTFAGTVGTFGSAGDGGQATSAELNAPQDITIDISGNIYIADTWGNKIRKINSSGIISTYVGNGTQGYGGDNGPLLSANFARPSGVSVNSAGSLYIVDSWNQRIRNVSAPGWVVSGSLVPIQTSYTPANSSVWASTAPTTFAQAIDRIAQAIYIINTNTAIP